MDKFKWIGIGGMQYLVDSDGHRRGTIMPSKYGNYYVAKIGEGGSWVRCSCMDEAIHNVQMKLFNEPYAIWVTLGGRD